MPAYLLLIIAIPMQFFAAFLALHLMKITKRTLAWTLIAGGFLLMAFRRCFTLYEWWERGFSLMPVDIYTEIIGLATVLCMLLGVAFIAPLFSNIKRSEENLRQLAEDKTGELRNTVQALQLELSERQQAEEALRKSEERFRTVADFTYDWEYWLAPDGSYNYISPSVERITGYRAGEFLQHPALLEQITHPEDRDLINRHIQEDLAGSEAHSIDFRIITKGGVERWVAHVCQPVFSPDGRNLGRRVSNRDITPYKQAEAEKAKLESHLRQAQKMEAIGTLAGGIAHDFNNILAPIIMYTEIALRSTTDENLRLYLEQVHKSSLRASDLVKQILAISRQTEQQPIIMQLGPITKEVLKLLRATFPATIELNQEIVPEGDWILADPTEIYQVVMNLCTNAAHAMEAGSGILEVSIDQVELTQEQVDFEPELKPGAFVRLSVKDNGRGMPPEVLERIFEPYFTTKETGKGTGLGLALVHGIVHSCHGGIQVASSPGQGTTFQVFFPLVKTQDFLAYEESPPVAGGNERILLVDDEADIVAALTIMLEQAGYGVTSFTDSREALAAFQARPESFDLIITDLTMPKLTGLELAKEILRLRPQIPILMCTGFGEPLTLERAKSLGVREVMVKPILPQQLAKIREMLDIPRSRG